MKFLKTLSEKEITFSYTAIYVLLAIAYIAGLFVPLMDNDSAHHASMALNMLETGDWASLVDHGRPYLDKPHFQFWLVAASYALFGAGGVAYKISSLLFSVLALYSTYRLAEYLSDRKTASVSVLLLSTYTAFAMANSDVRMDAILASAVVTAVWQGLLLFDRKRFHNLVLTALSLAVAFSTKGWVGVMVPCFVYLFYLLRTGNMKWLAGWRFPVLIAMFFLFISPVLYAFYLQYDMHPELSVGGRTGNSGVRFILWGQIFDRMEGGKGTANAGDPFFFLHTVLWALLPWGVMFYMLLFRKAGVWFRERKMSVLDAASVPAIVLTVLAFSVSKFKLPHYINIVFPLMAVFMASELMSVRDGSRFCRAMGVVQKVTVLLTAAGVLVLNFYCFPVRDMLLGAICIVFVMLLVWWSFFRTASVNNMLRSGAVASAMLWIMMNMNMYPQILEYQAGNVIGEKVKEASIDPSSIVTYRLTDSSYSLDIYAGKVMRYCHSFDELLSAAESSDVEYVFVEENGYRDLSERGVPFDIVYRVPDYRVTIITAKFLNPDARGELLKNVYLLRLTGPLE